MQQPADLAPLSGPCPSAPALGGARPLAVQHLGRVRYSSALALQQRLHQEIVAGRRGDTLLLVEHDPVITAGSQTLAENLLVPPAELCALGIDYVETGRGGDVTYHGPGQLVGYPLIALQPGEQDVRAYVYGLEEVLIRTVADFGVTASRCPGMRGIWVGNDKLAAIGIRLAKWVTSHGFALNVETDLTAFAHIVPCGLHGRGVTSLAALCARPPTLAAVGARVVAHLAQLLRRTLSPTTV